MQIRSILGKYSSTSLITWDATRTDDVQTIFLAYCQSFQACSGRTYRVLRTNKRNAPKYLGIRMLSLSFTFAYTTLIIDYLLREAWMLSWRSEHCGASASSSSDGHPQTDKKMHVQPTDEEQRLDPKLRYFKSGHMTVSPWLEKITAAVT